MGKIHLIGNAHIDPVWLWRWQEGYSEVLSTFRSALDRLEEFDDFVFTCAGAMYYQWVEKQDPEMFEEIKKRVKEGRWVIVGGWMLQPDCNAPCGESFARHSLYAQNYFEEKFGVTAKVGYNVDSFGHSGMLPQILKKCGLNAYVYLRPEAEKEMDYPFEDCTFMWISPDGQSVPTFRIHENYGTLPFEHSAQRAKTLFEMSEKLSGKPIMSFYGVGNHGGGPTVANIQALKKLQDETDDKDTYVFSSPNKFFEELDQTQLPELRGDLHHHASGCYTSVMKIKALNRKGEAHILSAERSGVMANLLGFKGEKTDLKEAWRTVLFNQFHDIMGGCCIRGAVDDAVLAYGHSIHLADVAENESLQKIAWNIDTTKGKKPNLNKTMFRAWESDDMGVPVVVFNTNAFCVKEPVCLGEAFWRVEDENGKEVEFYQSRAQQTNGPDDKFDTQIIAEVPAMGWRLYWGYMKKENSFGLPRIPDYSELPPFENKMCLENDCLKVDFSENFYINKIYDKKNKKEIVSDEMSALVIEDGDCDMWAHMKFSFDEVVGKFEKGKVLFYNKTEVCDYVRISYAYNNSEIIADYRLYKGFDDLRITFKVNWQEKLKMLKLEFPTAFKNAADFASAPYGYMKRKADGKEQPMQKWVAAVENGYGLGISTDTRTAYSLKDGNMRISCLRSAIFADHYGNRDLFCEYSEQGEQQFTLSVAPVENDFNKLQKTGELLIKPLSRVFGTYHKGTLPSKKGLIDVSCDNVIVSAVKFAEDGNGVIVNAYETDGKNADAEISIGEDVIKAHFNPFEIKSFRIYDGKITEVNFLEKNI